MRNHAAGNVGGALKIVGGARGHLVHENFFADAPAKEHGDGLQEAVAVLTVPVGLGQLHGHAQRAPARDDGDFVHRVGLVEQTGDDGVTRFVIGGVFAFFFRHHHRAAFGTHHDFVLGALKVFHIHQPFGLAGGEQRRFIDEVGQIRAGKAGRAARQNHRVDAVLINGHLAHVHFQDLFAPANVGQRDDHLTVKAPRAHQRRVEHVRTVGGGNHDDAGLPLKTIHFHQQLVQRLFAFIVAAAHAGTALAAYGVDFVDKDDAGRVFFRLVKHVAHARRAHADEHFHEVRAGNGKERHFRLTRNRFRQQGFPRAGRADHQHALGNLPAQFLKARRVAQKFDQLGHFFLGFIATGDIREGHRVGVVINHPRLAATKGKRAAAPAALHLAHEENPHANQQQHGEPRNEDVHQQRLPFFGLAGGDFHARAQQVGNHPDVLHAGRVDGNRLAGLGDGLERAPVFDGHAFNHAVFGLFHEGGVFHRVLRHLAARVVELLENRHQHDAD